MRVKAQYSDGASIPRNHPANFPMRYRLEKNKVYIVFSNFQEERDYSVTGNKLALTPLPIYLIEKFTNKELLLTETRVTGATSPIRHFFIPTDSFTLSRKNSYQFTATENDTTYDSSLGIEPLFKGHPNGLLNYLMEKFMNEKALAVKFTVVILKDGSVGNVEIISTINDKQNKRLIQTIQKTSGKWIPAHLGKRLIKVKTLYTFNMGSSFK